jgi:hypothetical protein
MIITISVNIKKFRKLEKYNLPIWNAWQLSLSHIIHCKTFTFSSEDWTCPLSDKCWRWRNIMAELNHVHKKLKESLAFNHDAHFNGHLRCIIRSIYSTLIMMFCKEWNNIFTIRFTNDFCCIDMDMMHN